MNMNPRRRRKDEGPAPILAVDLTPRSWAPAPKPPSPEQEKADCDRRWAYLKEQGWKLTEEGLVLDTSDSRWSKTDRILIEYVEGLPFHEGVRAAYMRQKMLEAEKLAREQRREPKR